MGVYSYLVGAQKRELHLSDGSVVLARNLSFAFKFSYVFGDKDFEKMQSLRYGTAKITWRRLGKPNYVIVKDDIVKDPADSYGVTVAYPWFGGYEWVDTTDFPVGAPKYFVETKEGRKKYLREISALHADTIVREGLLRDIASGKRKRSYFDEELSKMSPLDAFEKVSRDALNRGEKYVYLREEGMY